MNEPKTEMYHVGTGDHFRYTFNCKCYTKMSGIICLKRKQDFVGCGLCGTECTLTPVEEKEVQGEQRNNME